MRQTAADDPKREFPFFDARISISKAVLSHSPRSEVRHAWRGHRLTGEAAASASVVLINGKIS
jgi:hypothetical protein